MVNDITWEDFCNLYYDFAKDTALAMLAKQKALLGGLDRHVDEDYVIDETVLSSLEKTFASYTSARGAKVTTLLSRIVHNQLIDILEEENKRGARKDELEDVERTLCEHLRAEALEVPREDLVAKLMNAVSRLSPADQVIIECYLRDRKTFVEEAAGILNISKNCVSVRKNRILQQLRGFMGTSVAQYKAWKMSVEEGPVFAGSGQTAGKAVYSQNCNPIMPNLDIRIISENILAQYLFV